MLSKKFYTREEVENLYQVYSEKVKDSQNVVDQLNAKFADVNLNDYQEVTTLSAKYSQAKYKHLRNRIIFKAIREIAKDVIRSEIANTFASDILSKFVGKSVGTKTHEKVRKLIAERYNLEYVSFNSGAVMWFWHGGEQEMCHAIEKFIDCNNKFTATVEFYNKIQKEYPEDLESWVDVFLAKKEEHAKLLKELDEKIKADCEELEIGYVQLPHIQVNALR